MLALAFWIPQAPRPCTDYSASKCVTYDFLARGQGLAAAPVQKQKFESDCKCPVAEAFTARVSLRVYEQHRKGQDPKDVLCQASPIAAEVAKCKAPRKWEASVV